MATRTMPVARPTEAHADGLAMLVGRLALAAIFIVSGFGKLTNLGGFEQMLASQGVPAANVVGVLGACVEFFGGLAIAIGFEARLAALLMIAFTIVATLIAHRFWEVAEPAARMGQQINFMKNVAIIGGFLLLFARGAGPLSIDRLRGRAG
jgi:putative oxidoreductase